MRKRSKRKSKSNNGLNFQNLEDRRLLAADVYYSSYSDTLYINGSGYRDVAYVQNYYSGVKVTAYDSSSSPPVTKYFFDPIERIRFSGSGGDDYFSNGTSIKSTAYGGYGNDVLIGGSGDDYLSGWYGNDRIYAGNGNDRIYGGSNNDTIYGQEGADYIDGDSGDDYISAGSGNDTIYGDYGDDTIYAGSDDDYVSGSSGNDRIYGQYGNDTIYGGSGQDYITGQQGDDWIDGGYDNDTLYGYTGNDTIKGGSGNDTISGWYGDDVLKGEYGNDVIYGHQGRDEIFGGWGNDRLDGGLDDDMIQGEFGEDILYGQSGNDTLYGGYGSDKLYGGSGNDGLFGGVGYYDQLFGNWGADRLLTKVDSNGNLEDYVDRYSEDTIVKLKNWEGGWVPINGGNSYIPSSWWNDNDVMKVDKALKLLHDEVGNTKLLKWDNGTRDVTLMRAGYHWRWAGWNARNGEIALTSQAFRNDVATQMTTFHEYGHNWDHPGSLNSTYQSVLVDFRTSATGVTTTPVRPGSMMTQARILQGNTERPIHTKTMQRLGRRISSTRPLGAPKVTIMFGPKSQICKDFLTWLVKSF